MTITKAKAKEKIDYEKKLNEEIDLIEIEQRGKGFATSRQELYKTKFTAVVAFALHIPDRKNGNKIHHFDLTIKKWQRKKVSEPYTASVVKKIMEADSENIDYFKSMMLYGGQRNEVEKLTSFLNAQFEAIGQEISKSKLIMDKPTEIDPKVLAENIHRLSANEICNIDASIKQTIHKKSIKHLNSLLYLEETGNIVKDIDQNPELQEYSARQPEKIFQNWIEKNLWSLGVEYIKKHSARKIGIATESDLIMETTDGFIDLIELKRPSGYDIFRYDDSHKCYYPDPTLSETIGQCLHYLKKMDEYKNNLQNEYKVKVLKPRIKIIMGRSNKFEDDQYEALRMLNSNLNHIEILTYDYLLNNAQNLITFYEDKK